MFRDHCNTSNIAVLPSAPQPSKATQCKFERIAVLIGIHKMLKPQQVGGELFVDDQIIY